MRFPASPHGKIRKVIRTKPSIEDPSNMMSPSSAFSNCDRGSSTFLFTPRMSVNWSRRNLTSFRVASSRMSFFDAPSRLGSDERDFAAT
jgi:hypothetical protein